MKQATRDAIQELNLSFLILAKQVIGEDREAAMLSLGVDSNLLEIIEGLSPAQMIRMANTEMMLCGFRFDDEMLVHLLCDHSRPESVAKTHAAILALSKPLATV